MTTVLNGLIGGLVAGLVAAGAARLVAADGSAAPSPAAAVLGRRAASGWSGLAAAALYGCVAGGALVAFELSVLGVLGVPPATREALGVALGWSVALFVALAALERVARGRALDRPFVAELAAYHLVYGLCLGVWIRATWIT